MNNKNTRKKIVYGLMFIFAFTYISIFIFSIPNTFSYKIVEGRLVFTYPINMIIKRANKTFISLLEFNLGYNIKGKSLSKILLPAFIRTSILLFSSIAIALLLGIIKGISDSAKGKKDSSSIKVLSSIIPISLPDVLIAAIMQSFAIWLNQRGIHILKVAGSKTLSHSFLPIIALSILPSFYIARITTLAIDDCYRKKYVMIARSKGCTNKRVLWNHVMRNAIKTTIEGLPNVTSIIMSNTLIVEYMFSYPGLTTLAINHIIIGDGRSSAIIVVLLGCFYFIINGLFRSAMVLMDKLNRRPL